MNYRIAEEVADAEVLELIRKDDLETLRRVMSEWLLVDGVLVMIFMIDGDGDHYCNNCNLLVYSSKDDSII